MEIKAYTIDSIVDFIESDVYKNLEHLPISPHRARAQALNPRAQPTDEILFVAWEENQVAGYIGVLPDLWNSSTGLEKVGWLSCIWVNENFRSLGIAGKLFHKAKDAYKSKLLMTGMVPEIVQFYIKKGNLRPPFIKKGIRCYLRFNLHELLPPKGQVFKRLKPLLKGLDIALNALGDLRLKLIHKNAYKTKSLQVNYTNNIDPDVADFISSHNNTGYLKREKTELEWITQNPWILEKPSGDRDSDRYYFSSYEKKFFYRKVVFRKDKNEVAAFLIISIRKNKMTVPYFFGDAANASEIADFLIEALLEFKLDFFTVYHSPLVEAFSNIKSPFIFSKSIENTYLISDTLEWTNPDFQDGDGDVAFT
jgi:GNAT superfamily N-acetyltransferase